jgi:hypothetical protein
MSVRELKSGFIGLRVQRQIPGEEKPRIKNFSFRIPIFNGGVTSWRAATARERAVILKEAEMLDLKWQKLQTKQAPLYKREFDPFRARTNTGIVGIRYAWSTDGQGYPVEAFWINLTHEKRTRTGSVRLACRTWSEAWRLAVQKVAAIKELDDKTVRKLVRSMPSEEDLRKRKPRQKNVA